MKTHLQIIFGDDIFAIQIVNEVPLEAKVKRNADNRAFQILSEWFERMSIIDGGSKQHEFEKTIGQVVYETGRVKNVRGLWPRSFYDIGNDRVFKFTYDQAEVGCVVHYTRGELKNIISNARIEGALYIMIVVSIIAGAMFLIFK